MGRAHHGPHQQGSVMSAVQKLTCSTAACLLWQGMSTFTQLQCTQVSWPLAGALLFQIQRMARHGLWLNVGMILGGLALSSAMVRQCS